MLGSSSQQETAKSAFAELKSFLYVVLLALSIRVIIFEPFYIPSGSMRMTTIEGDYLFTTKYSYGFSKHSLIISPNLFSGRIFSKLPERGDIVIFRPPHRMNDRYIKRLIGMPGDKIQLLKGVLYINDKPVERELVSEYHEKDLKFKEFSEKLPNGKSYKIRQIDESFNLSPMMQRYLYQANNTEPFYVPADNYFFLGDNRDQSGDSRYELGFVPFENFISKVRFVFFSFSEKLWMTDALTMDQIKQIYKWLVSFRTDRFLEKID